MKKLLTTSVIASLAIVTLSSGVASAWHYSIKGTGTCQTDGSYKITWTLDNTSEPTALEIKQSNRSVVKAGDSVPAKQKKNFTETVDGTKAGSYTLTLRGDWKGDRSNQKQEATVKLDKPCEQPKQPEPPKEPETPTTPEEPGRGAGEVLPAQVTVAPVGAVNAGEGAESTNYLVAALGLIVSAAGIAYGVVRLVKARN